MALWNATWCLEQAFLESVLLGPVPRPDELFVLVALLTLLFGSLLMALPKPLQRQPRVHAELRLHLVMSVLIVALSLRSEDLVRMERCVLEALLLVRLRPWLSPLLWPVLQVTLA